MSDKGVVISVVIPAYNYAHTLGRTVSSVVGQLTPACELLIINDGSTDNTAQVIEQLQARYPVVRAVTKVNGGLASVRNRGIEEGVGQYLMFLDADDEMAPGALAALLEHIKANPDTRMVIGGHISVQANGARAEHRPDALAQDAKTRVKNYLIDKTLRISNGACAMHREVFNPKGYPEHFRNAEDIPVFAQVLARYPCTTLNAPLALIYKHDDSLRHNVAYGMQIGDKLIGEVFARLPESMQSLRNAFAMQRNLSLFRTFAAAGEKAQAKVFYKQALQASPKALFKWSYTRKAIRLWFT